MSLPVRTHVIGSGKTGAGSATISPPPTLVVNRFMGFMKCAVTDIL